MRPLRIVFLDSWKTAPDEGSGTAVGIATLARALRKVGHDVATLRPEREAGTSIARLRFNLSLRTRLSTGPPPDLVVGFDVDGLPWGAGHRRTPYVVGLKGVAADEARYSRTFLERRHLSFLGTLERWNARAADRVLVPSRYSARIARRAYGLPPRSVRVVPEPIDLAAWDELRAAARRRMLRRPTILSVAKQYPRKDTATLLRALSHVRERLPDVHLRVVGDGPELPGLRALVRELQLNKNVTFHGALGDHEAVRRAYFDAHVFCLPSRQEGFGIVFLEAMAAGLPIVAARAGAVPEVVCDGEAGHLVPTGAPRALADALTHLLEDRRARRELAAGGLRRVRRYGLEPVARAFLRAVGLRGSVAPPAPTALSTPSPPSPAHP